MCSTILDHVASNRKMMNMHNSSAAVAYHTHTVVAAWCCFFKLKP